jgi:hypothetical protein
MTIATNLPPETIEDGAAATKLYFERYGEQALEFPANDVTLAVSFFKRSGFDDDAATTVAMVLLRQAKIDGDPIALILDTMKNFPATSLSQLVGEVLNNNRVPTSILGFRTQDVKPNQIRNIAA